VQWKQYWPNALPDTTNDSHGSQWDSNPDLLGSKSIALTPSNGYLFIVKKTGEIITKNSDEEVEGMVKVFFVSVPFTPLVSHWTPTG